MKTLLFILAISLILVWGILYLGFHASSMVHILLAGGILIFLNLIVWVYRL